jgi:hypothetical protein
MARSIFPRPLAARLLSTVLIAASFCFFSAACCGQERKTPAVEGYITSVYPAGEFAVNGLRVTVTPQTVYGLIDKENENGALLSDAVKVGQFVEVMGTATEKSVRADAVLFSQDWDRKLAGFGVIDKVIATGPETLIQADGYRIRVTSGTITTFAGAIKSLADVGTNTWVGYKGKRDREGVLQATRVQFFAARAGKIPAPPKQEAAPSQDSIIDGNGEFESAQAKVRLNQAAGPCGWRRMPGDNALQERVRRVGMSVVPEYQKQLPANDAAKIYFRFYAVDDANTRADFSCAEGLVLVPRQMVERLKNDDQLAAVLADGVAFSLQRQSARLAVDWAVLASAELAAYVTGWFIPGVTLGTDVGGGVLEHELEKRMEEQRGRVALALMADAGYDPRQAPEAWRLLAPKKLPGDLRKLKYPNRSGYQLGILNVQYRTAAVAGTR